jgi:hypothetical protein
VRNMYRLIDLTRSRFPRRHTGGQRGLPRNRFTTAPRLMLSQSGPAMAISPPQITWSGDNAR